MGMQKGQRHENSVGMNLSRSGGAQSDGSASACPSAHGRAGCSRPGPFANVWILLNKQLRSAGQDEAAHSEDKTLRVAGCFFRSHQQFIIPYLTPQFHCCEWDFNDFNGEMLCRIWAYQPVSSVP